MDTTGQENNRFINSLFTVTTPGTTGLTPNSVEVSGSSDWTFVGCSFDNVQLAVSSNASVHVVGGHFENPSGNSYDFFVTSGLCLDFTNVLFQQDNTSSFPNGRFGSASAGAINVFGGTAYSGVTLTAFIAISGVTFLSVFGLHLDSAFTNGVYTGSTGGGAILFPYDGNGNCSTTSSITANTLYATNNVSVGNEVLTNYLLGNNSGSKYITVQPYAGAAYAFMVQSASASPGGDLSYFSWTTLVI